MTTRGCGRVFIGGPIEHALCGKRFDRGLQELLTTLISALEHSGLTVFSAHRHEEFGRIDMAGRSAEVVRRDFRWMCDCDLFVAVLPAVGDQLLRSDGTCIELGWASALGKPVVMVRGAAQASHLIAGLPNVAEVSVLSYSEVLANPALLVAEVGHRLAGGVTAPALPPPAPAPLAVTRTGAEIVLQAVPFCYGPASIALAIAGALRARTNGDLMLTGAGQGVALELLRSSPYFDRVLELDPQQLARPGWSRVSGVLGADLVVTVADFDLATQLSRLGKPAVMVDPLYWMWDADPIPVASCRRYFALDFPGTSERIAARQQSDLLSPVVVEPVLHDVAWPDRTKAQHRSTLVINLGGVECPLGANLELAVACVGRALAAALRLGLHKQVYVCGGRRVIAEARRLLGPLDGRVRLASLPHRTYLSLLAGCDAVASTPGMSSAMEALAGAKKALFLLPMNYSQHRQMDVLRRVTRGGHFMTWDDFQGYHTLPAGLAEERGVEMSFALGRRFAADSEALDEFEERFTRFLLAPPAALALAGAMSDFTGSYRGAVQIADWLLATTAATTPLLVDDAAR